MFVLFFFCRHTSARTHTPSGSVPEAGTEQAPDWYLLVVESEVGPRTVKAIETQNKGQLVQT